MLRVHSVCRQAFLHRSVCALSTQATIARESMGFDVVVVGAGPAGLSAAIKLKQLAAANDSDISVCVVEKGSEVGSHILSGNVFDPRALNELIPDWKEKGAPLHTEVKKDKFRFLTESRSFPLFAPSMLSNHGCYAISLGALTRWLGNEAEQMGVEIFPGFAASEVLYNDDGSVQGIATSDLGLDAKGKPKPNFQRGIELTAQHTLFAEGSRGSLSELVMDRFNLRKDADPQTYSIGIKEVWELDESQYEEGLVSHTLGWPLDSKTYGGSFMYHMQPNLLLIGMIIGLDYTNPYMSPYKELQRLKHHPSVRSVLQGGTVVSYGARAISTGGVQALPKLCFPGGSLIGCSAGFVNVPRTKGSHTAMKSGMLAAEAVFEAFKGGRLAGQELASYPRALKHSWLWQELYAMRNVKPAFKKFGGVFGGVAYSGLETLLLKGKGPWTFHNKVPDVDRTLPASECSKIDYPKPDGEISFDLLTNLARSGTNHEHDQPCHLTRRKGVPEDAPTTVSLAKFDGPEQRFCPAGVYEFISDEKGEKRLQINAQNCVHCKTCDIKTPKNYIRWTVPEGGGGPTYENM